MASEIMGEIGFFPYPRAASGGFYSAGSAWLPCDGRLVAVADYPALYQLIGTNYGGDSTAFALPRIANAFTSQYGDGWYICVLGIYPSP